jgi:hypothetical protein
VGSYRALTNAEAADVEQKLVHAADWVANDPSPGLQAKYDLLLNQSVPSEDQIELLGYAFGAELARCDWLNWTMQLDNEYGDAISIAVDGLELGCAPLDMIRNRVEDRESSDLTQLVHDTVHRLRQLGQEAKERLQRR